MSLEPTSLADEQIHDAAKASVKVVVALKKSGLMLVVPEDVQELEKRVSCLLRLLAFEDNNGPLPNDVNPALMQRNIKNVAAWVLSNNMQLPMGSRH